MFNDSSNHLEEKEPQERRRRVQNSQQHGRSKQTVPECGGSPIPMHGKSTAWVLVSPATFVLYTA